MDYALRFDDLVAETPAILVRGVSVSPEAGFHGTAGVLGTGERLQVVMVWPWEHTLDDNGTRVTVDRGKARYAKLLSAALFYDHRLSSPNLPGLDQAQVLTTLSLIHISSLLPPATLKRLRSTATSTTR